MPDRHGEWMNIIGFGRVGGGDRVHATPDRVAVATCQPGQGYVRRGWPVRSVNGARGLDDVEQMRHYLMVTELLRRQGDHRQVPLQRPHLYLGHDKVRALQAWLGDMAAEHPLRHHLRLNRDAFAS